MTVSQHYAPVESSNRTASYFTYLITHPLLECIAKVSAFAIGAFACYMCGLCIATPLLVIAGTMLVSQLVIKLCNHYNVEVIYKLQLKALAFKNKYPYLQAIAFVFTLAVAPLSLVLAGMSAAAFGVFAGIIVAPDHQRRAANLN